MINVKYKVGACKIGERVVAIQRYSTDRKIIWYYGYGTYQGMHPCELNFNQPSSKVLLDNGSVIWGCQDCFFERVHMLNIKFAGDWKWIQIKENK
jgi:hypothetical protein